MQRTTFDIFCKLLHIELKFSSIIEHLKTRENLLIADKMKKMKKIKLKFFFSLTFNADLMGKAKHLNVKWEFNLSK